MAEERLNEIRLAKAAARAQMQDLLLQLEELDLEQDTLERQQPATASKDQTSEFQVGDCVLMGRNDCHYKHTGTITSRCGRSQWNIKLDKGTQDQGPVIAKTDGSLMHLSH